MPAKAAIIQATDMIVFLEERGFKRMQLPDTKEIVFGKRIDWQCGGFVDGVPTITWSIPLTIRVYTSIVLGHSRNVGKDAIRVNVWAKGKDAPFMLGGDRRVHRVEGWRANLGDRLDNWTQCIEPQCPECGAPMVLIKPRKGAQRTFTPFYGCIRYVTDKCRGTSPYKEEK